MKKIFACIIFSAVTLITVAQTAGDEDKEMQNKAKQRDQAAINDAVNGWWTASQKTHDQRVQWWREAKFGMFIHWGIYSLPGGEWKGKKVSGYAEHLMRKEKILRKDYLEVAHQFNPEKFNAEEWILNAKNAGMKYFIITSKHHDGFAMFDSKVSDFNIIQQTPFKRDPMAELAAAAKKYDIKFGFYYSHAFDWEHRDAPGNDWEYNNPGGDKLIGGTNWYDLHPEWLPKAVQYVDEKAIPQIRELLLKYHPDILWFDTPGKLPLSENIRIMKAIRATDPNVVVNGRLARSAAISFGDYKNTADRPAEFYPVTGDWEAIPTTNESYGYHKYDSSHKPVSHFIQLLANAASRGGNLLMNIGPKGDGSFDVKDLYILNGIGKWMNKNGESIYGTTASSLPLQNWGVSTWKANKLYLHVFNYPADGKLYVGGLKSTYGKIYLLADPKKQLAAKRLNEEDIFIDLPLKTTDTVNTVIVLELSNKLVTDSVRFIAPNISSTRLLAFDATQHGKGFGFGDGKTNRFYVDGWKSIQQSLSWTVRLAKENHYNIVVKYLAGETSGGAFKLVIDKNTTFDFNVEPNSDNTAITKKLNDILLSTGIHEIAIQPTTITKQELMRLLEIQLVSLDKKNK
jgi:alpha-L-fucosidase